MTAALADAVNALQTAIGLVASLERDQATLRRAVDRAARALATLTPTDRDASA